MKEESTDSPHAEGYEFEVTQLTLDLFRLCCRGCINKLDKSKP